MSSTEDALICKICDKTFAQRYSLIHHTADKHGYELSNELSNEPSNLSNLNNLDDVRSDAHSDTGKDVTMSNYNERKRKYSDDSSNDNAKKPCYLGSGADMSDVIVTGFMHSYFNSEANKSAQADIIQHLVFECTWVVRKRKHYIQAILAVLTSVNELHTVSLPNVAKKLAESWTAHREFDWDQFIVMLSIVGSFYRKRPDLYLNIREMLMYYCAYNCDAIEYLGGWESALEYTNLDLSPDNY